MTTKAEIRTWLNEAEAAGATHVIVVCDTYDHSDYPVVVYPTDNLAEKIKQYETENKGGMQRVMEVYNLSLDLEKQLDEQRAYNL